MNRKRLRAVFDGMAPDDEQKIRMKRRIWEQVNLRSAQGRAAGGRWRWAAGSAAGLLLAVVMMIHLPFGKATPAYAISVRAGEDGAVFRFMDREGKQDGLVKSVSYVDPRPMLEFCIEGENIAKIHIKTENEYVYAVDWTKTQHEKYWNVEYYQHFDEATQTSVADFSLLYDKEMTMTFDEGFRDYDRIWYRWTAWNMYQWAAGDNFSRFYGYGYDPISIDFDRLTEEEKSELAAGSRSALGHMNLDEYPDHLQEDVITITITDRQGQVTTKAIRVRVDNNKLGQTVVTAELVDDPDSGQRR